MEKRPNVLWICTDQQRFDTLGCYGNPFVRTPHLDRLASEGALFERCYSQSPVCTPSRASFLTGRYPRTTRARQNGQNIPADEVLVTRLLADRGWSCGLSGKLHISVCNPKATKFMEPRIADGYSQFHWSHHAGGGWPTNEYHLWLRERGERYQTPPHPASRHIRVGMPPELHQTTWCADKAIAFVESHAEAKAPWLFSVNIFDPHHPFDAPERYLEPYLARLDEIPLPNYVEGELDDKPVFQRIDHDGAYGSRKDHRWSEMSDKDHRLVRASYWAMCDLIDAQVGRLLETLERTGQRDNTLVIFASDHGEMLGDHGLYWKGPYFYEPALRVPLIVSWPGVLEGGRRCGALVELMDLAPTLLDAAGLERWPGMQARSLWPLLTGQAPPDRLHDDVYCEYYNAMPWHKAPQAQCTMVRSERHKIVVCHGTGDGELYDLESDPNETRNRWNDPAFAGLKTDMLRRLCDRMSFTVDPLPPRLAPW
jgi:choline-sulfatase